PLSDEAFGQKKPPIIPGNIMQQALDAVVNEIPRFKENYEQDEFPYVMVVVGLDSRPFGGRDDQQVIDGREVPILTFDPSGTAESVRAEMVRMLRRNRSIELIDLKSLSRKQRQDIEAIVADQGRSSAQQMLAEK